uniref:Ribonuclease H-like domain-containing protein n=1 Tax=Tanacetum cinerariifolium TaxID=118510 RepID=A0A6L2KIA6_TANCI|nr:ribonuclease H-like domain-containing protein [Tanacetum cinerariifolium]
MRIEQYIQMIDYALWEVIINGNAAPRTHIVNGVETVMPPTIAKEKNQRRLEVKARSTLMMGLPNEHQLKFNSIRDVKSLLEAIKKRLQKLVSQLQLLGEIISQEDINQKFFRSLPSEWVNTASSQVNTASSLNIDNVSDAVICAILTSQPNSTHFVNEDLEQIHPDDLEEMDLKWKITMLTIKARRFLKNTGRKLNLSGNDSIDFDKTKVECYNCHKRGHFARECRAPKGQDNKNKEATSDQAEEGLTNYALMAYSTSSASSSDSKVSDYSKSCLKVAKNLKSTKEQILKDLRKYEINVVAYKEDNCKKGLGYNAVPPPHAGLFAHPKHDLPLEEDAKKPIVQDFKVKVSEVEPKAVRKSNEAPIIEDWVSYDKGEKWKRMNSIQKQTTLKNTPTTKRIKTGRRNVNAVKGKIGQSIDYKEINKGYVAFGGNPKRGKITGRGKIKTGKLDFEYVYFVRELKFNLFNVSQMCDKKNSVLFIDTECIVLSSDFKLIDENQVLLRVPRLNNMYSID